MNELLIRILLLLVTTMSPALRVVLVEFIARLEAEAKKSSEPWDDILVSILKTLLLGQ